MAKKFWLTPPEMYKKLDDEFHFDFDPCPFPRDPSYNALEVEWGLSNYVNPPFTEGRLTGLGPTAFVRKSIEEFKKGKNIVIVVPVQNYVNLALEAGAVVRSMGRPRWLEVETKEPRRDPSPIIALIFQHHL